MRNLINILESVGLANRKPGEKFANPNDETLTFRSLNFYPERGQYDDADQLTHELNRIAQEIGIDSNDIVWSNTYRANLNAFGIAHFTNDNSQDVYVGRFFNSISANRTDNNFPNNAIPGGYQFQSKSAKKESAGYKPSDILTQFEGNTVESIVKQVDAKFGVGSDMSNALNTFIESDYPIKIHRGDINAEAFDNYFSEILQPLSLILGKQSKGNAAEAELAFFGDQGFTTCVINFNKDVSGGLSDSVLTNSVGSQIKVSSKSKGGANASAVNILNSVKELNSTNNGKKLIKKYKKEIEMLEIIDQFSYVDGPLALAVMYDIITDKESKQVKALADYGPFDPVIKTGVLSKKLEKMYQSRNARDMTAIKPMLHLLAVIAERVADYINKNTNFGEAAAKILNNGALIQVYTDMRSTKDHIVIHPFTVVFPSTIVTDVVMTATKSYFSTGNKGKLTFKILKNGAKIADTELDDHIVDTTPDYEPVKPVKPIKAHSASKAPTTDAETLGRKRRAKF